LVLSCDVIFCLVKCVQSGDDNTLTGQTLKRLQTGYLSKTVSAMTS
jgi:hypothetical protein